MSYILGVAAGFHDAAVCLLDNYGGIEFAAHSERYSKLKNDANLCPELVQELWGYDVDHIAYYERPWLKQLRQWRAGQGIEWSKITAERVLRTQLHPYLVCDKRISTWDHHLSHAAAGFQTSPFQDATVVVVDAIGEFATASIYSAEYDGRGRAAYQRLWSQSYPHSVGLFYSAVTQRCGLRPLDEEYITMGMAAWGEPRYVDYMRDRSIADAEACLFRDNLHTGLGADYLPGAGVEDIAASAQVLTEELLTHIMRRARALGRSSNLVYQGGVALNCLANRLWGNVFDRIWIMPCPGDAGSAIGAAALAYGYRVNWTTAYLGRNIPGDYPVDELVNELSTVGIAGVASGRAEFGPRALGNRSLLADPRGPDIKARVNSIKRRQQFRPFAPAILEELVDQYFEMPPNWTRSRYMQTVARCLRPDLYPAIVHVDGTSRVQTVPRDGSGFRALLEAWYAATGCPMLLNTSLNIRGEPMVNDRSDADRFESLYGVKVFS